jgi:hypothetical protein
MCAEKSAGVRFGTEAFALGGFTETLTADSASQDLMCVDLIGRAEPCTYR